jgi:hypothetical protein
MIRRLFDPQRREAQQARRHRSTVPLRGEGRALTSPLSLGPMLAGTGGMGPMDPGTGWWS